MQELVQSQVGFMDSTADEAVRGLVEKGIIEICSKQQQHPINGLGHDLALGQGQGNWYSLTTYGKQHVHIAMTLTSPTSILEFQRAGVGDSSENLTAFEIIRCLTASGWTDQATTQPSKAKSNPYRVGSQKVWFRRPGALINIQYLRALKHAHPLLIEGKITEVHHFQPKAYYDCIISGVSALPGQPLAYYKYILGAANGKKNKMNQKKGEITDVQDSDGDGDISNLNLNLYNIT